MTKTGVSDVLRPVAMLGLGTMGHGIAQTFALAGYSVRCYDEQLAARRSTIDRVARNLKAFVEAGLLNGAEVPQVLGRVEVHESLPETVQGCGFVTEAIFEDLALKQDFLRRLEPFLADDAIVASNSSSFPVSQSASGMRNRQRAIVTHWFNPPHLVPLVEVVPSVETSEVVIERTMAYLRAIGKRPVRLKKELPGFLINRIQVALMREIWDLVDQDVASPEEIDAAVQDSMGFRLNCMGPLEIYDFGGLDIQSIVYQILVREIRGGTDLPGSIKRLVEQGQLGAKTGQGFHTYSPERFARRIERRDRLFLEQTKRRRDESND
ncbi:MAG: 3-hydroxyacyl-CoA dehydrogenase family protein [Planctomycetota bacterium]